MKEPKYYRANVERIKTAYPDKEMLTITDVANFCGFSRAKVRRLWGGFFTQAGISVATLAHLIC